ncbi:MAG: hypothetical protein E6H08_16145 [Bacteroidetes bacterium]|nr:MAG: hypothetical protein E6H08_16145 [Bacteroidota bacterium]
MYYLKAGERIAPGFLQYDNITYIAYAKQYSDADSSSLFYSNPFNDSKNYPNIYFQIQNFLFLFLYWIGIPPGIVLICFTLVFSFITFKIIIQIFDHVLPNSKNRALLIILFAWGGGLLTMAGAAGLKFIPIDGIDTWDRLFVLDPGSGWWGLNLGRSLIFSTEAYYHVLFFGGILCILKKKWKTAAVLALLIFLSHPYTGVEYLSIIVFWIFVEIIIKKNREIPLWFGFINLAILILHISYYMIFLNQFADHHSVHEQCSLSITVPFYTLVAAYCIVGLFTLLRFISKPLHTFFASSENTLFLSWFIIVFLLINHQLFMKAMEPVHFTRGYEWSSLFIIGLPAQERFINYLKKKSKFILLPLFCLILLNDNILWLINYSRPESLTQLSVYISQKQKDVLNWLEKNTNNSSLVISGDNQISILSTVYTKAYPWTSHNLATPFLKRKQKAYENFITNKVIDSAWYDRDALFILNETDTAEKSRATDLPFKPDSIIHMNQYMIIRSRLLKK